MENIGLRIVLGAQIVALVVFALLWNPLDFFIYRLGGQALPDGTALYLERQADHFFTYPPFAALFFTPLSWIPLVPARLLWELASVAVFGVSCREMLLLAGRPVNARTLGWTVAGGLMLEPVWHTLFLGQINLFLVALVLFDLRRAAGGAKSGIGLGIAAAIKLTPGAFIVLLLLAGRTRAAVIAAATFAGCCLLGLLANPDASWLYWRKIFYDTTRVGVPYISNQSPYGALVRLLGGREHVGSWYLVIPMALSVLGLAVATRYARRADWASATAVGGITSLLVSPISWSHHWVWALPALVVLMNDGRRWAAFGAGAVLVLSPMWWLPRRSGSVPLDLLLGLTSNAYLVLGLALLGWFAVTVAQAADLGRRSPRAGSEQKFTDVPADVLGGIGGA
jgi:alpha-1,2-mannosyltransferase